MALALSVAAELGLAVALQHQTLVEFIKSRDKVSGSVYVGLLLGPVNTMGIAALESLKAPGKARGVRFGHSK